VSWDYGRVFHDLTPRQDAEVLAIGVFVSLTVLLYGYFTSGRGRKIHFTELLVAALLSAVILGLAMFWIVAFKLIPLSSI
jgi:hypothetical protein